MSEDALTRNVVRGPLKFYAHLYTGCFTDLYNTLQEASTCDTNVEYHIWSSFSNLFLSYAERKHTHIRIYL